MAKSDSQQLRETILLPPTHQAPHNHFSPSNIKETSIKVHHDKLSGSIESHWHCECSPHPVYYPSTGAGGDIWLKNKEYRD
jgi:hypothetical protein